MSAAKSALDWYGVLAVRVRSSQCCTCTAAGQPGVLPGQFTRTLPPGTTASGCLTSNPEAYCRRPFQKRSEGAAVSAPKSAVLELC